MTTAVAYLFVGVVLVAVVWTVLLVWRAVRELGE